MSEPALRISSRVRGILIAYGVAAFCWFFSRALPSGSPEDDSSGGALFAVGLALQVALVIARVLVKRYEREHALEGEIYPQAMYVFELFADAVTVLLFAVGTFRAIFSAISM